MPKLIIRKDWKKRILSELELVRQGELFKKETWKVQAYIKAIASIEMLENIYNIEDVIGVNGIGSSIISKIKEIIETGYCQKAREVAKNPQIKLVNELLKINGVGPVKALKLLEAGITNISSLKDRSDLLTSKQLMGVRHYESTIKRIPREEIDRHNEYLNKMKEKIDIIIAGSYRRQKPNSGDIDVLVTCQDNNVEKYHRFISKLKKVGYLTGDISYGDSKYNGYCILNGSITRRIDIMFCTKEEYPFALLYFTGSGDFNQEMRGMLSKQNYRLNEHCLMKSIDGKWEKVVFKCTQEKDIFDYLKIPYIKPEYRTRENLKRKMRVITISRKIKLVIVKKKCEPINKMLVGECVVFRDQILKRTGDSYMCDCAKWKFQRLPPNKRTCKHLVEYLGEEYEQERIGVLPIISKTKEKKDSKFDFLLANKWNPETTNPTGYLLSEKLDGVRSYWTGTEFISRLGNKFPVPKWFIDKMPKDIKLDGELFGGRGQFQTTVSIVKNSSMDQEWNQIVFQVFDAPEIKDVFEKRIETAKRVIGDNKYIKVLPQIVCKGIDHVYRYLKQVEKLGGEGVMIRQSGSYYEGKRSNTLLKVKSFYDGEAIVIGHNNGSGKHKGRMGSLQCRMECGKVFRIGTGFSDNIRDNPPPINSIVTYRFQEYTKAGKPRFPSYVGIRIDAFQAKDHIFN